MEKKNRKKESRKRSNKKLNQRKGRIEKEKNKKIYIYRNAPIEAGDKKQELRRS